MEFIIATIIDWIAVAGSIADLPEYNYWANFAQILPSTEAKILSDFDSSIEGINSQEFSVGIFYFLIASIVVFTIFVFMYMFKDKTSKLKKGEKILFIWILFGVVVAVGFGAAQMLHGYLF